MEAPSSSDILQLRQMLAAVRAHVDRAEDDAANDRAIISDLVARIALLTLQIEKMNRERFGQRLEHSQRLIDQLELSFEETQAAAAEGERLATIAAARTTSHRVPLAA